MRNSAPLLIVSSVWERPDDTDLAPLLNSVAKAVKEVDHVYDPGDAVIGAYHTYVDIPGFVFVSWGSRDTEYYSGMWHLSSSGAVLTILAMHSSRRPHIDLPFKLDYNSIVRHHFGHRVHSRWTVEESYDSTAEDFRLQGADLDIPEWVFPAPSIYAEFFRVGARSHVFADILPYMGR